MIVGSFGPWARVLFVTVSGVDGDGWFVVGAAVVALVMLYLHAKQPLRRWPLIVSAVAGGVALAIVISDGKDIFGDQSSGEEDDLFGDSDLISPGWGIVMAGLASASLIASSIALFLQTRKTVPEVETLAQEVTTPDAPVSEDAPS